jgi:hypothetical protein
MRNLEKPKKKKKKTPHPPAPPKKKTKPKALIKSLEWDSYNN